MKKFLIYVFIMAVTALAMFGYTFRPAAFLAHKAPSAIQKAQSANIQSASF